MALSRGAGDLDSSSLKYLIADIGESVVSHAHTPLLTHISLPKNNMGRGLGLLDQ